jgi:hypothetical protein
MAGPAPRGFNATKVIAGLHAAMAFGAPSRAADQAAFYIQVAVTPSFPVDQQGVPWDPANSATPSYTKVSVPVAVEFHNGAGKVEGYGIVDATTVTLTLLDADYQQVKGFAFVAIAGTKYWYRSTDAPVALGTIDVWTVHCEAVDAA